MENYDALFASGTSPFATDGGLTKSLLDSASLSSPLGEDLSSSSLVPRLNTSVGKDPLLTGLDAFSPSNSVVSANSQSSSQGSTANRPFQQSLSSSQAGFDAFTGFTNNAPLVGISSSDLLANNQMVFSNSSPGVEGEFGSFGGKNVELAIKDGSGSIETFSLTGDGYGEVTKNSNYEQITFSGTDASTAVQISGTDNLKLGDYTGAALNVQTAGDLTAGNIFSNGGAINLVGQNSVAAEGNITTSGGTINVQGGTQTTVAGTLDASDLAAEHKGGTVQVLGNSVSLLDPAQINVSGSAGGGTALIGGDLHGQGTVPNASSTLVSSGAKINADAVDSGNGGKVVVWSDDSTHFLGNISARGGSQSGNGGQVEVSSKQQLDFQGMVYANAVNGSSGTLLLDPKNITVEDKQKGVLDFEGIGSAPPFGVPIGNFYSTAPYDYGIQFSNNALSLDIGNYSNNLTVPSIAYFHQGSQITIDDVNGFDTGFSTFYAAYFPGSIAVYSGPDGTGSLLATQGLSPTPDPYYFWIPVGTSFSGIAHSVVLSGVADYIGFDNMTFGSAIPSTANTAATNAPTLTAITNLPSDGTFTQNPDEAVTISPKTITNITNTGTDVVLQANNDITVNRAITTAAGGTAGSLTLQAGRSIDVNANITTDNGDLTLSANDPNAVAGERDPGTAEIVMASGTTLNAGTGKASITLNQNAGAGNNPSGQVTVGDITAKQVDITSAGSITAQGNITTNGGNIDFTSASTIDTTAGFLDSGGSPGGTVTLSAAGDITTSSLNASSDGTTDDGGHISLSSTNGNINTTAGTLNASGSAGNGGVVALSATTGSISTGDVYSGSGNAKGGEIDFTSGSTINTTAGTLDTSGNAGGDISLSASGNITTASLDASAFGTGDGGDITISSTNGNITTGSLNASVSTSGKGDGGDITISSTSGNIDTTAGSLNTSGNAGGDISLSALDNIATSSLNASVYSYISGYSGGGNGYGGGYGSSGPVALAVTTTPATSSGNGYGSSGPISTGTGDGGDITLNSTSGGYGSSGPVALAVTTTPATSSGSGYGSSTPTYTTGTGDGGDITLSSTNGNIDTTNGTLSSTAGTGNGGAIALSATTGSIKTGAISSNNSGNSSSSNSTTGGNITLSGNGISTTDLNSGTGNVSLTSASPTTTGGQPFGDVTTGNITAQELDILSDSAVTVSGNITTNGKNAYITAIKNINLQNITAQNGATSLTSGSGAITVTGKIDSDNGVSALARQDINTGAISSSNDAVDLDSSQGNVSVSGTIKGFSYVSLAALKDVSAKDITSNNGKVGLISGTGNINDDSTILSFDDVYLGAAQNVFAQDITSEYGTILLTSNQGNVTVGGYLDAGSSVDISAQQNITTGAILSSGNGSAGEAVVLKSAHGTVTTTGNILTNGSDIYVSSAGDVVSQNSNFISNGGAITVISLQGSLVTGYLRSDNENGTGGKIYLSAAGTIKVVGSFSLNGIDYSIYTGTGQKGWVTILSQGRAQQVNKFNAPFLVGDDSYNGSLQQIEIAQPITKPIPFKPVQTSVPVEPGPGSLIRPLIAQEIYRKVLDAASTAPTYVDEINPITAQPYDPNNPKEYELVKKLTPGQIFTLRQLINDESNLERITKKEVFDKGDVEPSKKCFDLELDRHLGDQALEGFEELGKDVTHSKYATQITGSDGDYLVITSSGLYAFYDGLVKNTGDIVTKGFEPAGSVAEVKTG